MNRQFKQQSGAALIIGLVMLLLLTMISLAAVRVTTLEESMAGNLRNQNIAFQAAESALREAEALIDGGGAPFHPLLLSGPQFKRSDSSSCANGFCTYPDSDSDPPQSAKFPYIDVAEGETGMRTAATGIANIVQEPEYIIELLRIDPSTDSSRLYATFRITTRAWGGNINSLVQLQSTYRLHALSFGH